MRVVSQSCPKSPGYRGAEDVYQADQSSCIFYKLGFVLRIYSLRDPQPSAQRMLAYYLIRNRHSAGMNKFVIRVSGATDGDHDRYGN